MKLGIVGLPNVGKSTLFNAITQAGAEAANYPFCTIEPNTGVVAVPDERLDRLAELFMPKKVTPAVIEFVDIAGLVKGASKGEGLGNKFLSHIREVDAIVHVVRCFEDENIVHVEAGLDPERDIEIIETELMLADMESLTRRIDRARKAGKAGDDQALAEAEVMERILPALEEGTPARAVSLTKEQCIIRDRLFLLTAKPVLYAANISEDKVGSKPEDIPPVQKVMDIARSQNAQCMMISAQVEEEIASLPPEERTVFLEELGIGQSGLDRLVAASYTLLGLMSFLTAGPKEVRAWTIETGTRAPQAAGKIHTDFERGFIRAEIVAYEALLEEGSLANCKAKGLVRSEGKDYVMKDGDVVEFRFNV